MFDYVNYEAPCIECGELLTSWQSKSGKCTMGTVEPWEVSSFYQNCPKCNRWNEYDVEAKVEVKVLDLKITLDKERSKPLKARKR